MFNYILGLIGGVCLYIIFKNLKTLYENHKLNKKQKKLQEKFKKIQLDPINIDFKRRKQQIAYSNKKKQVEKKINELQDSMLPEQIAGILIGQIIVQIADIMVETDRQRGILDDLYSEK